MGNWYQLDGCHRQTLSPPAHSSPHSTLRISKLNPSLLLLHPCIQRGHHALGPFQPFCSLSLQLVSRQVLLKSPSAEISLLSPIPHITFRPSCHTRAIATASWLHSSLRSHPPTSALHFGGSQCGPQTSSTSLTWERVRAPARVTESETAGWAQQSGFNTLYRGDSMPVKFKNHRSVVHRPAGSASPGSLLEIRNFRPHPRPTESGPAFCQDSKVVPLHNNVLEVLHSEWRSIIQCKSDQLIVLLKKILQWVSISLRTKSNSLPGFISCHSPTQPHTAVSPDYSQPQIAVWFPTDICIRNPCAMLPHQSEPHQVCPVCIAPGQAHPCKCTRLSTLLDCPAVGQIPTQQDWPLRALGRCWPRLWWPWASKSKIGSWKRPCSCSEEQDA